jgi:hypothetical protein
MSVRSTMHVLETRATAQASSEHVSGRESIRLAPPRYGIALADGGIVQASSSSSLSSLIGEPDDVHEREAERISEQIVRMPTPTPTTVAGVSSGSVQRKCAACAEAARPSAAPQIEHALRSPARPLDASTRAFMEPRFGRDFSDVRVHSGSVASASAQAIGARAYTVGSHIVMGPGARGFDSIEGRKLLAHELTHVVQQRAGIQRGVVQRSMATYVKAMNQTPRDFETAAEHLNGEKVGDIKIVLKNLSPKLRVDLHAAALANTRVGKCSNIARLTEPDYLKDNPSAAKAADVCTAATPAKPTQTVVTQTATPEPEPPPPLTAVPDKCPAGLDGDEFWKCWTKEIREGVRHSMEGKIYEDRLAEAVQMLQKAGFGRAEGTPISMGPDGADSWMNETFNTEYWQLEPHPKFLGKLVLKKGKKPADAIDDLFAHLSSWRVDCGQFVQVANLYALRHALGTDGFNRMPSSSVSFELKPQASSSVQRARYYDRQSPIDPMLRYPDKQIESKTIEQLVDETPVGGRVMWTNLQASPTSAFRNENAIKLGTDRYAAHGFMSSLGKNVFSRKELELELAKLTTSTPDDAYIATNVFIAEIEHYRRPAAP